MGQRARMGVGRYAAAVSLAPTAGACWEDGHAAHRRGPRKATFTACFLEEDEREAIATFPVTAEGLAAFRARLRPDDRLAAEVGPNAYFFHGQVRPAVAEVVLVSPRQFAAIATSTKKTDRNDARTLARFLTLGCLAAVAVPDATIRELRQLFATRAALVQMTTQLKNRGHAALVRNGIGRGRGAFASPTGRQRLARLEGLAPSDRLVVELVLRQLDQLEAEILGVERAIIRRGRSVPGLRRLLQVRGLGLVAAIGVLAEIGDIARFPSAKQLVAYAGLASAVRQSGATEHRGPITKEGRTRLRGFMSRRSRPSCGTAHGRRWATSTRASGGRRAPGRRSAPRRGSSWRWCSCCSRRGWTTGSWKSGSTSASCGCSPQPTDDGAPRGAARLDSSWEWQVCRRYFSAESLAKLRKEVPPLLSPPLRAAS